MAFKYNEKPYNPIRASYSQSYKFFAPVSVFTPSTTLNGYSPQTAQISVSNQASPPQTESKSFSWSPWTVISSCRSGCLESSKGLRLVQRNCESGTCDGPSRSVQLCIPNEQVLNIHLIHFKILNSILCSFFQECPQYQPVTHFADQLCREQHWSGLHRGIQMWPSKGWYKNL